MDSSNSKKNTVLKILNNHINKAKITISKGNVKLGQLKMWSLSVRNQLVKIHEKETSICTSFLPKNIPEDSNMQNEMNKRIQLLEQYVSNIQKIGESAFIGNNLGLSVFIGHGRSPLWRELKDFINDRLHLPWDEFNREAVAGKSTIERISEMLNFAGFAFLIMTAEDLHSDDSAHARQNVVHEVGLFQGKLGYKKAIILLEEGCSEFSNIIGLSQIRFPKGNIANSFEEIRRVLEREGMI
jgi:predicted nucleotide-binding protein